MLAHRRVGVGVLEDVKRRLAVSHRQLECFAGLRVVDGDGHVIVLRVPEEANMDPVAVTSVELARHCRARHLGLGRVCVSDILDEWIDHAACLSGRVTTVSVTSDLFVTDAPDWSLFIDLAA